MDAATQTVVIIVLLLLAIPLVLSDLLRKLHVSEPYSSSGPTIPGPAFCHTCGKETDGAYYCGPGCYSSEEDNKEQWERDGICQGCGHAWDDHPNCCPTLLCCQG